MKPAETKQFDINEELNALKESDVRVTFTDIWRDYWHYRIAYYHRTHEGIRQHLLQHEGSDEKGEVQVDVDKFKMGEHLKWTVKFKESHNLYTFSYMINILLLFSTMTGIGWCVQQWNGWWYDWKDPLIKDETDAASQATAENTLRRMKYKRKVKNWQ